MLKELKFVQGAVAKKEFLPAMTHFAIQDGNVRSYNGILALSSPIPFDINCKPKAIPLVQAINNCEETVTLSMTPTGKLRVQSGRFKAFIDCIDAETPHVLPEGEVVEFDSEIMIKALQTLAPFVGDDASRPWCNGVLIRNSSAFATNNVCLVEFWLGSPFPFSLNIPMMAIQEMLRIKEAPIHAQVTDKNVTFHYTDGRWIRTSLLSTDWPDLTRILDKPSNPEPINDKIFEGLETVKPFVDKMERIFFQDGCIKTHLDENEGACYNIPDLNFTGVYPISMLKLLRKTVTTIDFNLYPSPCLFFGERLRGAIVGMVM